MKGCLISPGNVHFYFQLDYPPALGSLPNLANDLTEQVSGLVDSSLSAPSCSHICQLLGPKSTGRNSVIASNIA